MKPEHPLSGLMEQLSKLPGVGQKSAQRLAFFLLSLPVKNVETFTRVILETRKNIRFCQRCHNISFQDTCSLCQDTGRNQNTLCVVSEPKDIMALERTGEFNGIYHVLGGLISPIDGIHPEILRIKELQTRLSTEPIKEIILAINPTIEGDATILYLQNILQKYPLTISKLAYGLPIGSDIDYADELTLQRAIQGRTHLS